MIYYLLCFVAGMVCGMAAVIGWCWYHWFGSQ